MSQFMRRIVAACAFVGLIASVSPATHAAYTELSAANKLATQGIIVDQSANPADYRLGQNVLRQEAVGVAGRVKGAIPTSPVSSYTCKNVYSDVSEAWVCRAAELSADAKIVDPVATGYKFNPQRNVTRYEAMLMMMKASCLNPVQLGSGATHVDQTADAAVKAGVIASASAFDANRAATRGEVFLYAAELMDFANNNADAKDSSIDGCEGDDDGDLDLCDLLPDLPGCSDDDSSDDDSDDEPMGDGGDLSASLSSDSPESDNIPNNGRSIYTVFKLSAGDADVEVDEIVVERSGNGSEDDFDKIWIVENGVVVTNDRSISSDDTATFTNLNWIVEAGESRMFAIEAQMDATGNKENRLNVVSIVTDGGSVSGLPVVGNEMLTIDYSVSEVEFDDRGSDTTVDVGDEDATVAEFKLTNNSAEDKDVVVESVRLENNGSADVDDLDNIKLTHEGVEISDRVIVDGDYVTFVIDGGFLIEDGDSRNFVVKADVIGGDDGDDYTFNLSDKFDLRGYEEGSAIGVTVDIVADGDGNSTTGDLKTYTVDAGRFSISLDTLSPSAENFARGTDDVEFLLARVDSGQTISTEGVRVHLTGSSDAGTTASAGAIKAAIENDLENVRLVVNGSTVDSLDDVTCTSTTISDCYYDFDTDFELDDDDVIKVVANIDDNAVFTNKYGFQITASADFSDLEYVDSGDNVASADISGTAVGKDMTITSASAQIVRNDGYANEEFVAGVKAAEILRFLVDAGTSSDIRVQRIGFDVTASVCSGAALDVDHFTGFKLYADGVQVGDTEDVTGNGATGTLSFDGINLDVESNDQAQFSITADTATSASGCTLQLGVNTGLTNIDDSNGDDVTPTVSPTAATFSDTIAFLSGGAITVTLDGDNPDSSLFVADTNSNVLASFKVYADNDDVELKDLYFRNNAAIQLDGGTAGAETTKADGRVTILHLKVDGQTVSSSSPIAGVVDFNDADIVVPRNETVVVDLVADYNDIDDEAKTGALYGYQFYEVEAESEATGFTLLAADMTGVDPEGTGTFTNTTTAEEHLVVKTVPTLTSVDPISGDLSNGTKEVYGVKMTADAAGDISLYSIRFNVSVAGNTVFASPKLVDNGGDEVDYTCTGPTANVVSCVYDGTGVVETVSAGTSKSFYLEGTVSGVAAVGDSLSVQMLQTASNFFVDAGSTKTVDGAAAVHANADYTMVWSDVSSGNDSDIVVAQWYGDNEIPGLDTATVTNKVD